MKGKTCGECLLHETVLCTHVFETDDYRDCDNIVWTDKGCVACDNYKPKAKVEG